MSTFQQASPQDYGDASTNDAGLKDKAAEAKDKAAEAAGQGKEAAGRVAQTAAEQVQTVKDETVRQARDLAGEARGHLQGQVGQQHQALVSNLRSLTSELGSMTQGNENSGVATELVSQARDRVSSVADWLESREPGDLLQEVRTFAQRRPGAFLAGALVAGIVAGRMTRGAVEAHQDDSSSGAHRPMPFGTQTDVPALPPAGGALGGYSPTTEFTQPTGYSTGAAAPAYGTGLTNGAYSAPGFESETDAGYQAGSGYKTTEPTTSPYGTDPGYGSTAGGGGQL